MDAIFVIKAFQHQEISESTAMFTQETGQSNVICVLEGSAKYQAMKNIWLTIILFKFSFNSILKQ